MAAGKAKRFATPAWCGEHVSGKTEIREANWRICPFYSGFCRILSVL